MDKLQRLAMIADRLDRAVLDATAIAQLDEPLSLDDAYRVQSIAMAARIGRGERRIGIKMGFTSRAKMAQMGVSEMIWGRLTDHMLLENGATLTRRRFVHPRVEPEIAFLLTAPLSGRIDPMTAMRAVGAIAPAMEIIDSRYENFKFSLTDVVADNASSSALVIGPWGSPAIEFGNLGMVMEIDGVVRQAGSSAAILGHPVHSLVAAARLLDQQGESLQAGDIVLAGAATAAEPLAVGQSIRLSVQDLGAMGFIVGD
jgi:2-oxo-3-hexenedioate decarboxylase